MRFLYFYLMTGDQVAIREIARDHAHYWHSLNLPDYEGGPVADRTGSLIIFNADSEQQAQSLASADPFRSAGVIERFWLKQWIPETASKEDLA
jgi:hypothetical protein